MAKLTKEMIAIKNNNNFLILQFPFVYTEKITIFDSVYSSNSIEICYNKENDKISFQFIGKKNEIITGFKPKKSILNNMIEILEENIQFKHIKNKLEEMRCANEKNNMCYGKKRNRKEYNY